MRASLVFLTLLSEQGNVSGVGGSKRAAVFCLRRAWLSLASHSSSVQASFAGSCLWHELAASTKGQEEIVCASWHKRLELKGRKKKETENKKGTDCKTPWIAPTEQNTAWECRVFNCTAIKETCQGLLSALRGWAARSWAPPSSTASAAFRWFWKSKPSIGTGFLHCFSVFNELSLDSVSFCWWFIYLPWVLH